MQKLKLTLSVETEIFFNLDIHSYLTFTDIKLLK